MSTAELQKMDKFKSAVDDLTMWLNNVVEHPETTDENDVFILNTIPVTLLFNVDMNMYNQAQTMLAAKYSTAVKSVNVEHTLKPVDLAPVEPTLQMPAVQDEPMTWPQVAFDSPTYSFRQKIVELLHRYGTDALKQAFQTLKTKFASQYEGNLAIAACYLVANPGAGDAGLKAYFQTTPDSLLDMDAFLTMSPLLSCAA